MKKILIILLIYSYFIFISRPSAYIKKELNNDKLIISFLYTKKSNAVIIDGDLIVIKYNKELNNILKRNNITNINNVYTTGKKDFKILGNESIFKNKFNYLINNRTFCINEYKCTYVYANSNKIDIEDETDVIIVNENIKLNENILEDIYENWIDTFIVEENSFVTLEISKEGFIKFIVGKI